MAPRVPQLKSRPWRRLMQAGTNRGLGPALATANGGVRYEVVAVYGQAVLSVRIKTAANGGTIDIVFVGPDFEPDQGDLAFASLVGTKYTTGNPTQVAVAAGTEAIIQAVCIGDGYAIIKFTGTVGAGTISYCDVASADRPVLAASSGSSFNGILAAGEAHVGEVGTPILSPSTTFTRPADTTPYSIGDLVANSTTAGSVAAMQLTLARVAAGAVSVRRIRLRKSTTSLTSASFRIHAYASDPAAASGISNGDNAAWLTKKAGYLGHVDITMDKAFSDAAGGEGVPSIGSELSAKLASGQLVYFLIEARAAYTPGNAEVFTLEAEAFPN